MVVGRGRFSVRVLLLERDGAVDLRLAENLGHAEAEQAGEHIPRSCRG